jgi:hypothetical protein
MGEIKSERLLPPEDPMFRGDGDSYLEEIKEIWISLRAEKIADEKHDPVKEPEAHWAAFERAHLTAEWEWPDYCEEDINNTDDDPLLKEALERTSGASSSNVEFFSK